MKKLINLLILATMVFAVSTNVEAQTKRTTTRKTTTTVKRKTPVRKTTTPAAKPKPQMVDMGLSVKWSNIDLGAATTKSAGGLYYASEDLTKACGEGWRLPTLEEFNELINNCDKMILEKNGVPSCVEFTSKRNGAKLYFYFPKYILNNPGKNFKATNPVQGQYMIFLNLYNQWGSFLASSVESKLGQANYKKFKYTINQMGLSKVKYTEWPNEILNQFDFFRTSQKNVFFSYYMDWVGATVNTENSQDVMAITRPVYSVNDDEE